MDFKKGDRLKIKIPQWLMEQEELGTRILDCTVKIESEKAVRVEAQAMTQRNEYCMRCGQQITHPISKQVGYGPVCSAKLGIDRNFDVDEIEQVKQEIRDNTRKELWLPKSVIKVQELLENSKQDIEVRATTGDKYIYLKTPYELKDVCKSIKGRRWDKKKKMWKYPKSPFIAEEIIKKMRAEDSKIKIEKDDEFENLLFTAEKIRENQYIKEQSEEDLQPIPKTKFPAWEHQLQAYHFTKQLNSAMLAMDMGTGKTKVAIDLIVNRGHEKTLIICPSSVVDVWPEEFEKHAGEDVVAVGLREGSVKKRKKTAELEMSRAQASGKKIAIVINYEAVYREPFASWAKKQKFDMLITDESHRIKAPGGVQSRFCYNLGKNIPYKLALTGTPMPHSPLDIYAQYRFLDPGIFGTSFNRFKNKYAIMGGYQGYQVLGYQNRDELNEKFYSIAYKCDSEEVQDLPEKVFLKRTGSLSEKAFKKYKEIENEFYSVLGDSEITVTNVLTKLLRLQQLTSGYLPDDEGRVHKIDETKKNMLKDLFEDVSKDEPIVVFARFHHDLEAIKEVCESTDRSYCELSGRVNQLQEFKSGEYDVIAVQIKSGGVGVDLTRARYSVYYSIGHSLGDYLQSLKRVNRPGQERTTYFISLVINNTVDVKVEKALQAKKEVIDYILED